MNVEKKTDMQVDDRLICSEGVCQGRERDKTERQRYREKETERQEVRSRLYKKNSGHLECSEKSSLKTSYLSWHTKDI